METALLLFLLCFGGAIISCAEAFNLDFLNSTPQIPRNAQVRNRQAIAALQNAVKSPKTPSYKLIECEFPVLDNLNKLGDGSLSSTVQADDANLKFCKELYSALKFPFGNFVWLLTSASATNRFYQAASKAVKSTHTLKAGLPNLKSRDVCILVNPSSSTDYNFARQIVENGNTCILVNGFAKDQKSVSGDATMGYFLKPLTYNSQIAGYLIRCYPGLWTTLDSTGKVLEESTDTDILVPNTNTPDLRASVRLVQKAVDEKAMQSRR